MLEQRVNAVALGVMEWDGHLLLQRTAAWAIPTRPWRPIGGFLEFGERAAAAVVREYREELSRNVEVVRLLGVHENIAELAVGRIHEIGFWYELRFARGDAPTDLEPLPLFEQHAARADRHDLAFWVPVDELRAGRHEVFPTDLLRKVAPLLRS